MPSSILRSQLQNLSPMASKGSMRSSGPRHPEASSLEGASHLAVQFVEQRKHKLRGLPGKAGPQLERAVVGAHTQLCAGAAAEGAERRRIFRGALTEACEAGGCTDTALDYGAFTVDEHQTLRNALLRLCACLRAAR